MSIPAPSHLHRSFTDMPDHVSRLIRETDDAFSQPLMVGSLPNSTSGPSSSTASLSSSIKPLIIERASTSRDFEPLSPRRFEFPRRQVPIPPKLSSSSARPAPPQDQQHHHNHSHKDSDARHAPLPSPAATVSPATPATPISAISKRPSMEPKRPSIESKHLKKSRRSESGSSSRARLPSGKRLAENMADLFASFKKVEADEMLSPERLLQMKATREAQAAAAAEEQEQSVQRQKSWETVRSESALPADRKRPNTPPLVTSMKPQRKSEDGDKKLLDDGAETADESAAVVAATTTTSTTTRQNDAGSTESEPVAIHVFAASTPTTPFTPVFRPETSPLPSVPALRVISPEGEQQRPNMIPRKPVNATSGSSPPLVSRFPNLPSNRVRSKPKRRSRTPKPSLPSAPPRVNPFQPIETDDFVFLKSNPCTITMPAFRHGPIRMAKAEKDPKLGADENLDWTAFQMAIIGGAGEWDNIYDEDADIDIANDLAAWFGGFGFEGYGRMVTEPTMPNPIATDGSYSPVSLPLSSSSSTSSRDDDEDEDELGSDDCPDDPCYPSGPDSMLFTVPFSMPHEPAMPFSLTNEPAVSVFASPRFWTARADRLYSPAVGMKRWTTVSAATSAATVVPSPSRRRRDSGESLPQSPMMPLNHHQQSMDVGDVVPMGYNLGHDLGDFLKWEAEQMYAGSFYSP